MKVLMAYLGRRGGGNIYSLEMARGLSSKVDLVCLLSSYIDNRHEWEKSDFKSIFIPTYTGISSALRSLVSLQNYQNIQRVIKTEGPEIIYYPMLHPWASFINATAARGLCKIVTVHDSHPHLGEQNKVLEWFQYCSVRQANRVVVLNTQAVDEVAAMGIPKECIDIIPHGSFGYYKDIHNENKVINKHAPTILFFGRILPYKGLDVLLNSFSIMQQQISDLQLLIAGEGDLKTHKTKLSTLSGITIENRWIADDEVASIFLSADVLIVPYIDASQSGVIPIAYSMGIPVIASRIAGLVDQVIEGVTGLMVTPGNHKELATACLRVLREEGLRQQLVSGGYNLISDRFSWNTITDQLLDSFSKALKNN